MMCCSTSLTGGSLRAVLAAAISSEDTSTPDVAHATSASHSEEGRNMKV